MKRLAFLWLFLGLAGTALAQDKAAPMAAADTLHAQAETRVRDIIAADGVHVVHFWAPWCHNSISELRAGWYDLIERNPDVTFTFITLWNDGQSGRKTLDRYAVPARVLELTPPGAGPNGDRRLRQHTFLGQPITWTPTTWVFHRRGELAFALNYGEASMETLQSFLDATQANWSH